MKPALAALILIVGIGLLSSGVPFTKPSKTRKSSNEKDRYETTFDTIYAPSRDSIAVAGFEKPLRSAYESMYITNKTASKVDGMGIEITYSDTEGRMLHRVSHDISAEIPSGETRLIEVKSFDRNGLYYYRLSPVPPRAKHATPFDVTIKVTYITNLSKHENSNNRSDEQGTGIAATSDRK